LDPEFVGASLADYAAISGAVTEETMSRWPAAGTVDLLEGMSVLIVIIVSQYRWFAARFWRTTGKQLQ
jgi:hypothetical protein